MAYYHRGRDKVQGIDHDHIYIAIWTYHLESILQEEKRQCNGEGAPVTSG